MKPQSKIILRYILRESMGVIMTGVALFWAAGTLAWWPGWAVLIIMTGWIVGTAVVILRLHPDLLAERLGPRKGAKRWDTAILSLIGLLQLARYIVAGLDFRNGWTGGFPLAAQVTALLPAALGYALVTWATASNAYFSQVVRIQQERGQQVATGGPYRFVRHPAYSGTILYELCIGLVLNSWLALAVGVVTAGLFVLRTALEDAALQKELPGYADFAVKTRHRLLPGVW